MKNTDGVMKLIEFIEHEDLYVLVTEFINGFNLFDLFDMAKRVKFSEKEIRNIIEKMLVIVA